MTSSLLLEGDLGWRWEGEGSHKDAVEERGFIFGLEMLSWPARDFI